MSQTLAQYQSQVAKSDQTVSFINKEHNMSRNMALGGHVRLDPNMSHWRLSLYDDGLGMKPSLLQCFHCSDQ